MKVAAPYSEMRQILFDATSSTLASDSDWSCALFINRKVTLSVVIIPVSLALTVGALISIAVF